MSEELPDTTEAAARAIYEVDRPGRKWDDDYKQISQSTYRLLAKAAIAAHNEELKRQGWRVVKPVRLTAVQGAKLAIAMSELGINGEWPIEVIND